MKLAHIFLLATSFLPSSLLLADIRVASDGTSYRLTLLAVPQPLLPGATLNLIAKFERDYPRQSGFFPMAQNGDFEWQISSQKGDLIKLGRAEINQGSGTATVTGVISDDGQIRVSVQHWYQSTTAGRSYVGDTLTLSVATPLRPTPTSPPIVVIKPDVKPFSVSLAGGGTYPIGAKVQLVPTTKPEKLEGTAVRVDWLLNGKPARQDRPVLVLEHLAPNQVGKYTVRVTRLADKKVAEDTADVALAKEPAGNVLKQIDGGGTYSQGQDVVLKPILNEPAPDTKITLRWMKNGKLFRANRDPLEFKRITPGQAGTYTLEVVQDNQVVQTLDVTVVVK